MFNTPGWLFRFRMWKYNRSRGLPQNFGGMWKSDMRFRREAEEDIVRTSEGWAPQTIAPERYFVAKELAVRYEAAANELRMHYIQLCDIPTPPEADERLRRMKKCIDVMHQLSTIEQAARPALGNDIDNLTFSKE
ncbi:MAG: hypothetical protein OXI96_08365 [Acidimicrobiaceae bacterium]|nr:hypothetical protein [Acidimicrobiaceae bacterium]